MTKLSVLGAAGLVAIGSIAVVIGTTDIKTEVPIEIKDPIAIETIEIRDLRVAMVLGVCPVEQTGQVDNLCVSKKYDSKYCECTTLTASSLSGEVAVVDMPEEDKRQYWACKDNVTGEYPTGWYPLDFVKPKDWTCTTILAAGAVTAVRGNVDTPIVDAMRTHCPTCTITPLNHGPCPECLHWPGGCTAACPSLAP